MTENSNHYDIIFAGWGASTCILMIEMEKNELFFNKKILIIEPNEKVENDKTFVFGLKKKMKFISLINLLFLINGMAFKLMQIKVLQSNL